MIEYECPECFEPMQSPDELAGCVEVCPACGKHVPVAENDGIVAPPENLVDQTKSHPAATSPNGVPPALPAPIHFQCETCRQRIRVEEKCAGLKYKCPRCGTSGTIPSEFQGQDIGGWLILPAIGLSLGLVSGWLRWFMAVWLLSSDWLGESQRKALFFMFSLDFLILCFEVYVAVIFFQKKKHAPTCIIFLLYAAVGFVILKGVTAGSAGFELEASAMLAPVLLAAIWIPYFKRSKRVKATFVQ